MTSIKKNTDENSGRVRRNFKSELPEFCWACDSEGGSSKDLQDYSEEEERVQRELRQQKGSKEEGIEENKKETAIKMLNKKVSIEDIAEFTGLSIEQIKKLNENSNN